MTAIRLFAYYTLSILNGDFANTFRDDNYAKTTMRQGYSREQNNIQNVDRASLQDIGKLP